MADTARPDVEQRGAVSGIPRRGLLGRGLAMLLALYLPFALVSLCGPAAGSHAWIDNILPLFPVLPGLPFAHVCGVGQGAALWSVAGAATLLWFVLGVASSRETLAVSWLSGLFSAAYAVFLSYAMLA